MENQGLFIGVAHFLKGLLTVTTVTGDVVETKENLSRPFREAESGRGAEVRCWGRPEEGVWDGRLGASQAPAAPATRNVASDTLPCPFHFLPH